ncbi:MULTISPECIES: AtpZ/AtpI family protein [unclassified Helicobacter]|uniref:AtpZ/AtpI family protein n=1 Tax=unclassified Helicobacter TaxID=2593540 RepID=UPI0026A641B9|nr:AtpZ/AtpI family protein [Helicobacter sp. 'CLO3_human']
MAKVAHEVGSALESGAKSSLDFGAADSGVKVDSSKKIDSSVSESSASAKVDSSAQNAESKTAKSATKPASKPHSEPPSESVVKSASEPTARQKRAQKIIHGAYDLSLGISIVVAILLGLGLGFLMQKLSGSVWLLWLGIAWGVGAAMLNIHKAYKRAQKEMQELANDPKYAYKKPAKYDDDEDD